LIGDNFFASYQLKVILSTTPERRPNSVSSDIPSLRNAYSNHLWEFENFLLYLFLLAGRLFMSGREVEVEGPKERGDLCSYR